MRLRPIGRVLLTALSCQPRLRPLRLQEPAEGPAVHAAPPPPQRSWPVPLFSRKEDDAERGWKSDLDVLDNRPGAGRVLLINTGGTMGMTLQNGSLTPLKGYLAQCIRNMPEMRELSMPEIDIVEYDPLIDSSNIGPDDWVGLATQVRDCYFDYDGFVIIHGTDTMAYTASALSFMLEGLGKAVVLTGSMIPLAEIYNDARRNLLISVVFAAQLELCEVAIFFNDRLLRGNRASKVDSNGLDAFDTPNFPPLATVGARISSDRAIWCRPPTSRLRVHLKLDTSIVVLHLVPGFDDSAIESMVRYSSKLRGLVLSLYGTGNGPSRKAGFLRTIENAIERGVLVVAASQCTKGTVSLDDYEVGRRLLDIGVISAGDMTIEAISTKMAYLFGRGLTGDEIRLAMNEDLRGERSRLAPPSAVESGSLGNFLGKLGRGSRGDRGD